jgi:sugar lactone lactonase YvrE
MGWLKIGLIAAIVAFGVAVAVVHRLAPGLLPVDRSVKEATLRVALSELPGAYWIDGMQAVENLYLDPSSHRVYATDLAGYVHQLDGESWDRLEIVRSVKLGESALGIDRGPDGALYVCVAQVDLRRWRTVGGSVVRLDPEMGSWKPITDPFPSINGLAFDGQGRAYFASSRFTPLPARGGVYVMDVNSTSAASSPKLLFAGLGMTNGMRLGPEGRVYFTDTLVGTYAFSPDGGAPSLVYRKTRRTEGFDDLCIDGEGRLWMADPGRSTVKLFDPRADRLLRFRIEGIGQISACGLRVSEGREILYLTEIHRSTNPLLGSHDGRGVVVIPVDVLLALSEDGRDAR